ncbi:hypothetical protein Droror1_Dr00010102 [Drosera rotundifolia]
MYNMKNTGNKRRFMRIISMPISMIVKAGNLYLKAMSECEKSVGSYGTTASWGAMWGLPISASKPLPQSYVGNSTKEPSSGGKNKGIGGTRKATYGKVVVSRKELSCGGRGKKGGKVSLLKGVTTVGMDGLVRSNGSIVLCMEKIEEDEASACVKNEDTFLFFQEKEELFLPLNVILNR